ncbi:IS5 family transposase [Thiohalorhabdus methylotrophus]|uniref:IS5 family transposase n=1 Tax=Thiohalorhabdus methylotrophus TaxID=3242694 RepID=A0ABV4U1F3_9GAMM
MRGIEDPQDNLFSYVSLEERIPDNHPLRPIRRMVDEALECLSERLDALYADEGRPSIPPERLLRASLLQILYSVRSEKLLMEQLQYNLLFRWFVGLGIDDPVWDPSTFSKNRDRLLDAELSRELLQAVLAPARDQKLLSTEHFSVDGTLVEAWASMKSFQPVVSDDEDDSDSSAGGGRNAPRDFRGEQRTNDTHQSSTDPGAKLYKKAPGQAARLAYLGHLTIENRNGLVVATELTPADGYAERDAAIAMLERMRGRHRITVAADKGYDSRDFVEALRTKLNATPHVAQNDTNRRSAIDGRTTRHPGYAASQKVRKRVEEPFGWAKAAGLLRRPMLRGRETLTGWFNLHAAAYNLIRLRKLLAPDPA